MGSKPVALAQVSVRNFRETPGASAESSNSTPELQESEKIESNQVVESIDFFPLLLMFRNVGALRRPIRLRVIVGC